MIDNIQQLAIAADELRGSRVVITSSFTRARESGHDRHLSTRQTFAMLIEYAGVAFSGATLNFDGKSDGQHASFGVGLDNVVSFNVSPNGDLEITEHFGKSFERLTTVAQFK
jgi:hypothetical protein